MGEFLDESSEPKPEKGVRFVGGRHIMDGAESLEEAARMLRNEADSLNKLARNGWYLTGRIENDQGTIHRNARRRKLPSNEP